MVNANISIKQSLNGIKLNRESYAQLKEPEPSERLYGVSDLYLGIYPEGILGSTEFVKRFFDFAVGKSLRIVVSVLAYIKPTVFSKKTTNEALRTYQKPVLLRRFFFL